MRKTRRLLDEYQFPGFRPKAEIKGIFGDPKVRVIRLERTQKKQYAGIAAKLIGVITTRQFVGYGTYPVEMRGYIWKWRFGVYTVGDARR